MIRGWFHVHNSPNLGSFQFQNLVSVGGFWQNGVYSLGLKLWAQCGLFWLGMSNLRFRMSGFMHFFLQNFNSAKLKTFFFVKHFPLIIKPIWMLTKTESMFFPFTCIQFIKCCFVTALDIKEVFWGLFLRSRTCFSAKK